MKGTDYRNRRLPKGVAAHHVLYGSYRHHAQEKGLSFDLTWEQFEDLTKRACYYCGDARGNAYFPVYNGAFEGSGIDRNDNREGYTIQNSVPCCKRCNFFKRDRNEAEFVELCRLIASRVPHDVDVGRMWQSVKAA